MKTTAVEKVLKELFEVRGEVKNLKIRESELQEKVDGFADEQISEFVDGQLALKNGVIKIQSNPPKLVHESSEKAVSTDERKELADVLGKDYIDVKPNLLKMVARLNGDNILKKQFV